MTNNTGHQATDNAAPGYGGEIPEGEQNRINNEGHLWAQEYSANTGESYQSAYAGYTHGTEQEYLRHLSQPSQEAEKRQIPANRKLTTLKAVVEAIDKDIADHAKEFPTNPPVFVNGAMTALKNLKYFIDLSEASQEAKPSPVSDLHAQWKATWDVVLAWHEDPEKMEWLKKNRKGIPDMSGKDAVPEPSPVLRFVKASERKPAQGQKDQTIPIKPLKKHHTYEWIPKLYCALIWMGEHDGGADWHWYEGPHSGWHTKISPEDWQRIEWLEELPSESPSTGDAVEPAAQTDEKIKEAAEKAYPKTDPKNGGPENADFNYHWNSQKEIEQTAFIKGALWASSPSAPLQKEAVEANQPAGGVDWMNAEEGLPPYERAVHIKYADCGFETGKYGYREDIEELMEQDKDHPVFWLKEPEDMAALPPSDKPVEGVKEDPLTDRQRGLKAFDDSMKDTLGALLDQEVNPFEPEAEGVKDEEIVPNEIMQWVEDRWKKGERTASAPLMYTTGAFEIYHHLKSIFKQSIELLSDALAAEKEANANYKAAGEQLMQEIITLRESGRLSMEQHQQIERELREGQNQLSHKLRMAEDRIKDLMNAPNEFHQQG